MSRLSTIEPEGAEGAAKALLAQVEKSLGLVPNMTKVMANSPALLEGYLSLSGALAAGGLDAGVRERIAIAVAEVNKCGYCLSAHTYIGSHLAKIDEAELDAARQAKSEDGHTEAILQLAAAVVRDRGEISDALFEQVQAAGVSDQEIAETVGHVAVNVLTNLFNKLAGVDNDWPVVTPYPHPAGGRGGDGSSRHRSAATRPGTDRSVRGAAMSRPPTPPFTAATAAAKVQAAEDAWNTRDPEHVVQAYTVDSRWRNRSEFISGHAQITAFLGRNWKTELDYVLRKQLWAYTDDRIAVTFQYEWRDAGGQWWRSHGNEMWQFDDSGYMSSRDASINDVRIDEIDRRLA